MWFCWYVIRISFNASVFRYMFTRKVVMRAGMMLEQEQDIIIWIIWIKNLIVLLPLTNTGSTIFFNYEPRSNSAFSRDILSVIKDAVYVINLDNKLSKRTRWFLLFININVAVYFNSIAESDIPCKILNKIKDKSLNHNIFRIQSDDSIMRGFYCINFMENMIARKTLLDNTNLFSPNKYQKNNKIIC